MNQIEALTKALFLAITAPTDKKANQAIKLANDLANGLSTNTGKLQYRESYMGRSVGNNRTCCP